MVAKISTGGNMFGALAYNQNKVDSGEAKVLFSNRMLLSEDGNFSIGECMRSFDPPYMVRFRSFAAYVRTEKAACCVRTYAAKRQSSPL